MTCLMISSNAFFLITNNPASSLWPHYNPVSGFIQIFRINFFATGPGRHQGSFVKQILQISTYKLFKSVGICSLMV